MADATWIDRLKPTIWFLSPDGEEFTAYWRGDQRSIDRRTTKFDFPGINGSLYQDQGSSSPSYPLNFYFEGPNHDLEAQRFFDAFGRAPGPWMIEHPIISSIMLQPLNLSESQDPVESGNITAFSSSWGEPIEENELKTSRQIWAENDALQKDAALMATDDFVRDDEV